MFNIPEYAIWQNFRYLLRTPPRRDALRHSGGDSLLWTSATVTLYLEVELRRDSLPGTEQNTSAGVAPIPPRPSLQLGSRARMPENIRKNNEIAHRMAMAK